ncbi:MAG: hypothetical protein EZS28_035425 [Streblomastix strix]|uniref:Uncharacterized protein n=1 Tax=Streblomastix strix TaxID=222440 RepID=A0A5J4UF51_9EUKA|nr:MAG: hypothetical protein EZS28_035425 [Streblomastix strix]
MNLFNWKHYYYLLRSIIFKYIRSEFQANSRKEANRSRSQVFLCLIHFTSQLGQIRFIQLIINSSRFHILGESSLILNPGKEKMKRKGMQPPGKIAAFLNDKQSNKEENYQQNFRQYEYDQCDQTNDNRWIEIQHSEEIYVDNGRTNKTKPLLVKHHASILNSMFSLIFGTVYVSATAQRLTTLAISNHQINNPRYGSTWDINQLFEYWRERPESNLLSDEELQVKQALQLISLCLVRMEEIANIDISVLFIDDEEHTAAVYISPKQSQM